MEKIGENLKKLLLVGIGTAAVTAEKSKEILDELVKKGELTVEQGKVLNKCQGFCESINTGRAADTSREDDTGTDRTVEAADQQYGAGC